MYCNRNANLISLKQATVHRKIQSQKNLKAFQTHGVNETVF